jgi:DnaK suppressor protein
MSDHPDLDLDLFRNRLREKRAELEAGSRATEADRSAVMLDQQSVGRVSRMDAIQRQEMALEAERRRQAEIHRIDSALRRIEEGEYGYCVACDEPIALKRLEFDPAVPTCIACASKA